MSSAAPPSFAQIAPFIDRVPGFLAPGQEHYLFSKTRSLPNDAVIVEIGSFRGRSSCSIGFGCVGSNRKLFCIDPWKLTDLGDRDFFPQWHANIAACDLTNYITPLRGRSQDILADWQELTGGIAIDFIFIDGWHEYGPVLRDFQLVFPWVKDGGWIAMHDVCPEWPGAQRVWDEVASVSLTRLELCSTIACGMKTAGLPLRSVQCPQDPPKSDLPVHFFAEIAANTGGLASVPAVLQQLQFNWCWHLIVPAPLAAGEAIVSPLGRGTVRLHAPSSALGWKNSVDSRNAMLDSIGTECILWELDPADGWSARQLTSGRQMFVDDPIRTGAFVAPNDSSGCPRAIAWHIYPWFRWLNPAAPELVSMQANGGWYNVASAKPFSAEFSASRGIVPAIARSVELRAA